MPRLTIDRDRCEGHGMCEQVAPDLIRLDDNAEPIFDAGDIPPAQSAAAEAAVQSCPVAALFLHSSPGDEAQGALQDSDDSPSPSDRAPLTRQ